jgi:hypothetical protein
MDEQPALIQIIDWAARFELPNSSVFDVKDSARLMNVLEEVDGAAIYGIFSLLVNLCRRQPAPRAGWLTENGKPDGVRYTVETLSELFHRPKEEILRMLQITTESGVNLIRFVDGDFQQLWELDQNRDR